MDKLCRVCVHSVNVQPKNVSFAMCTLPEARYFISKDNVTEECSNYEEDTEKIVQERLGNRSW